MLTELSLSAADYGLLVIIVALVPIASWISHLAFKQRLEAGDKRIRMKTYAESFWMLIGVTGAVMLAWIWQDRDLATIGFTFADTPEALRTLAVAVALVAALCWQVWSVGRSEKTRASIRKQLEGADSLQSFMPQTREEYLRFRTLSVVAGVTEEIIFRGYLIWALTAWFSPWVAAGLSLLVFTIGHLYQESPVAIVKVAGAGAIMTALYMISGSLLPAILLHIALDVSSNATVWKAFHGGEQPAS